MQHLQTHWINLLHRSLLFSFFGLLGQVFKTSVSNLLTAQFISTQLQQETFIGTRCQCCPQPAVTDHHVTEHNCRHIKTGGGQHQGREESQLEAGSL